MKASREFDVIVIGGGVGGVATVRKLASVGLSVALVEDRLVGGECHYWGCNPSKTLLRPIEVFNLAKAVPGVREVVSGNGLDVAAVFAKRDAIIENLSDQDRIASLREAGAAVFHGFGRLSGQRTVRVSYAVGDTTEAVLTARHAVVLATGTRPNVPEIPGLAQARPWTNRDLTTMTRVPPRALVVGGGPVAVEFATILTGFGSAVTLLVRENTLIANCEPQARELVTQSLRSKGVTIHFETELSAVCRPVAGGCVNATFHGQTIEVDEIVLAAGRRNNTDNIGLETLGLPRGEFVSVDDHLQAVGVTGGWLYALGDTTGRARLSHISTYHGRVVADIIAARAAGRELSENELTAHDAGNLAQVIHTDPQVAWAGRTESQARAEGFAVRTRTARYPGAVSFLALYRDGFQGWAKLVINDETDTLLGATFVGPQFSELVQAATLAIVAKVPVSLLRHAVAPHPTVNQVWDPLLAEESELARLLKTETQKAQKSA
ncbi:dihydrolipoyl dehydrogenase family protein [Mycobacterium intracellulare]|uniref:Oxidoreductase n=1 Tax=Mycobacterium intracellulare subsp. chimaera TaxID=222805 RepID=A0A220YEI5_MYCIT|nr:NAD(P)/FAD-dependent oxidoreductase [Mycobacterium intracellulare]AOS92684.1 pyridine nucleotide-disulfide oxidoreductase [Mycobacterium intracellulare subsp. chimaera]ARV82990.1 pyridine nucleotide-disulfide oxidoreductase [Mycobacterium intracellulare subsp. chimaera]ASL10192.1 oxidoreductase [Mycobacterium intracellulare subsp. chimaera]ASL15973.1 oxidoreductase [Mycobacterium intracellulare subsp. chimaera]ASL22093.1 oxidoreductase [Mycobacterium intracellulare subsp. chimaera]